MAGGKIGTVRTSLRAASFALVALAAGTARADQEPPTVDPAAEARQQYASGSQAFAAKRFVEAELLFEAAAAQRAHAVTLYTAALAWEQANRPERACDAYGRALEVPGLSAQQATNARDRVAVLEKTLGTLAVMAPLGEAQWRVQLVGLTEVVAPARLHAPPGVHQLVVRMPDGVLQKHDVVLDIGQTTRMELEVETKVSPREVPAKSDARETPPASAPKVSAPSVQRQVGLVTLGVGAALLGAGMVLGFEALDARDAYNAAPARATLDHAQGLQTWTNIALVAGAVVAAGGLALVILPDVRGPVHAARLTFAPGMSGGALQGSF